MSSLASLFPEAEPLSSCKGAYLLQIELDEALTFALRGQQVELPAGIYVYAGSANGPGGIAARVARHMRRAKKPHWHVDALTLTASNITARAFPNGSECALVERLIAAGHEVALPGFGSSDCRSCPAHLLRLSGA